MRVKSIKVFAVVVALTALAACAETAALLDATANQMCQENPTQECYDNGRL